MQSTNWMTLLLTLASFTAGLLLKRAIIHKHKKRVLQVENDMLETHARVLELEAKNNRLQTELTELKENSSRVAALKAS